MNITKRPLNIEAYTDGSAKNNGKKNAVGGWAFVVVVNGEIVYADHFYNFAEPTNQKMELHAALTACSYLDLRFTSFDSFIIYSDSAYLVNCVNQKWYEKWLENGWKNSKGEDVSNKAYWVDLIKYFDDPRFTFEKVKGHSDCEYNNIVDELAQSAAEEGRKILENCNS